MTEKKTPRLKPTSTMILENDLPAIQPEILVTIDFENQKSIQ